MKNKIPIISFFSGGGFMDMGFMGAGFDVVFANEYDKVFADLHDEGIREWCRGHKKKFCPITTTKSITELNPENILREAFPQGTPKVWGVIGGPPCQDFTMNGKGRGFEGERGKMTQIFYNQIRKMQPSFFVMENVVGLIMRKEPKRYLDTLILSQISDDYFIDRIILNALDFGVPQYRRRVFIIGMRKEMFSNVIYKVPTIDNISSMDFPWPKAKYVNAATCFSWPDKTPFGTAQEIPKNVPMELCVESCLKNAAEQPNGKEYLELRKDVESRKSIYEGDTKRRSFKRLHRFKYSPTTCFGNNEVFLHPYENRRITVREALRIQGVDDKYVWEEGRLSQKFKIISNGVPVPLAKAVAYSLHNYIDALSCQETKRKLDNRKKKMSERMA